MRTYIRVTISLLLLLLVTACQQSPTSNTVPTLIPTAASSSPSVASPTPPSATHATDQLLGHWQGVEGTYLNLTKTASGYGVEIANLDGARKYDGVAAGDHIEFTRNGKKEKIRSATGKETGMKYLVDEKNCLVVTVGSEAFCRK